MDKNASRIPKDGFEAAYRRRALKSVEEPVFSDSLGSVGDDSRLSLQTELCVGVFAWPFPRLQPKEMIFHKAAITTPANGRRQAQRSHLYSLLLVMAEAVDCNDCM